MRRANYRVRVVCAQIFTLDQWRLVCCSKTLYHDKSEKNIDTMGYEITQRFTNLSIIFQYYSMLQGWDFDALCIVGQAMLVAYNTYV